VAKAVLLNLPDEMYEQIKERASRSQRSVEAELLEVVSQTVPEDGIKLPTDLANVVASLALLDDKTLWQAARSHISNKSIAKMEKLHHKRGSGDKLTPDEEETLKKLLHEYDKYMLIRSEAMNLLIQRGHDVSKLFKKSA
jgi:plasmid stability protein